MADIWWYERRHCWCADVPDDQKPGKRKRLYFGQDEDQARQGFHEYMARYHARKPAKHSPGGAIGVLTLVARFLGWAKTNLSPSTYQIHVSQLKPFAEKHGRTPAADITPSDVEQHKGEIHQRGCKPRTVNFFVQSIKRLYNWAVEQGILDESPIRNVKRVPSDPPRDRSLDAEQVEAFLQYARENQLLGDFCEVLLHTGMRTSELLGLKWADIDFDRHIARIFNHKTASVGDQRPRTIPLNDRVLEILQQQAQVAEAVFTGEKGQPVTYNSLKGRKDRLERQNPDMPHVTFHQFRHTFATRLARAGVPERVAQEILGHSSTLMTRYYTTTPIDEMLDAVGRLDDSADEDC